MPIRLPQKTASSGTVLLCPSPDMLHIRVLKHPPDLPPIYERIGLDLGYGREEEGVLYAT